MLTPADIIESGERHVEAYLTDTGYHCHQSAPSHGAVDIAARGEEDNLYVHVMTALDPHPVPELTTPDRDRVLTRAMTLGYDSWLAKVQVGPAGELVGDIEWSQLNH